MSPYSMPLCTVLTKCPAPPGPIHAQHGVSQAAVIKAQKAGKTTVDISGKNGSSDSESPDEI